MIIDKNNIKVYLGDNGKILNCPFKGIAEIRYLPEGVETLYCYGNELTALPELPESLIFINCRFNPNLLYAGLYRNKEEINKLRKRINMDLYLLGKI